MAGTDIRPRRVPALWLLARMKANSIDTLTDLELHEHGAEEILLERLKGSDRRLWGSRTAYIVLGVSILDSPVYNEKPQEIGLTAIRYTDGNRLGEVGLCTTIAHRVTGNQFDVVPVGGSTELAWKANAAIATNSSPIQLAA